MSYQYERKPLNDEDVDGLTDACDTFQKKFVVRARLDTGLRLSEFVDLKKGNIQ